MYLHATGTPTRQYHGSMLIHTSSDTGAISPLPCTYASLSRALGALQLRRHLFWTRFGVPNPLPNPNGIIKYSQCPVGVLKAVFHSSPSRILTRWYAFLRSSFVKMVAPCRSSKAVVISGRS